MLKRYESLFMVFLVCLVGCHHKQPTSTNTIPHHVSQKTSIERKLPAFNNVEVKGPFNVQLHTGYQHPRVIIQGDTNDLPQIITRVVNHTLIITAGAGYPKFAPVNLAIQTHTLNSFTYSGVGTITGSHINTRYLDLSIKNPGTTVLSGNIHLHRLVVDGPAKIQLSGVSGNNVLIRMSGKPQVQLVGVFNFSNLNLYGDGLLSAYWVKNDKLVIRQHGNTHVQLAGIAKVMDVELWGHAEFNGRYLRANRAFVKTHGNSVAKLSAVDRQHTLATDASDIYFYNLPVMRTDFMAYQGAVLDMRDWDLASAQEYTVYNK